MWRSHITTFTSFAVRKALQLSINNITLLDQWCNHVRKSYSFFSLCRCVRVLVNFNLKISFEFRMYIYELTMLTFVLTQLISNTYSLCTFHTDISRKKRRERRKKMRGGEYLFLRPVICPHMKFYKANEKKRERTTLLFFLRLLFNQRTYIHL